MAKFAAIQLNDFQQINQDALMKFTSSELKKKFKCKKVAELKHVSNKNAKVAEFSQISAYELYDLCNKLMSINLRNYSEIRYKKELNTKIFVFSDDASSSAFAFDVIRNDCTVKLFDLNEDNIDEFVQAIATIKSSDENLSSLNEAKDLCDSLTNIEYDLDIDVIQYNAIETIEEKISDIEDEVQNSKELVEDFFSNQWN